jgi:hypothetical protein
MIEWLEPAALAKDKDVRMSFGDQQRGPGSALGDDRVDRMRGAVNEGAAATQQCPAIGLEFRGGNVESRQNTLHRLVGNRGGLEHGNTTIVVFDDQVCERSASIGRKAHRPAAPALVPQ